MEIEIYFKDLTEDVQKEIMDAAGISDPREANWDVFPITTLCVDPVETKDKIALKFTNADNQTVYMEAHQCDDGIDYTVYDENFKGVDGGVLEIDIPITRFPSMGDIEQLIPNFSDDKINVVEINYNWLDERIN